MSIARSLSFAVVAVATVATVAVTACDKTGDAPAASTSASAVASASAAPMASAVASVSAAPKMRRHIRRGGIASAFLATASEQTTLKPDQLTKIEALDESLRMNPPGPAPEWTALHTELAAEVKAGKLDAAKLDPLYAAVDKSMEGRRAKEAVALNGLHAILDGTERKAVTAALRDRQKAREEKAKMNPPKPEEWRKHHVERLAKDLGLDDAQQKQLDAAMAKTAPTQAQIDAMKDGYQKRREALLTAFEADTFDATKLDLGPVDKTIKSPSHHESDYLDALLPILKADQRDKLAERLGHGPAGHGGPGGRMGGGDNAAAGAPAADLSGGDIFEEHDGFPEMGAAPMAAGAPSGAPSAAASASH